ncbi:MAG: hypothetical protein JXA96_09620 [Sedimentisphaerales bacterium]|nr:hypothetical protein [Sedimentisphaerales bacterium]
MSKKGILSVIVILVCLILFSGCDKKTVEQMQSELDQVKATLDKTQAELDTAKIRLEKAEKLKQEYDILYVVNQNLEGQLKGQKAQVQQLADRIARY